MPKQNRRDFNGDKENQVNEVKINSDRLNYISLLWFE